MFEVGKIYKTLGGVDVKIIFNDRKAPFTIVGLMGKDEEIVTFTPEGTFYENPSRPNPDDLVPLKKQYIVWATRAGNNLENGCMVVRHAASDVPTSWKKVTTFEV